MNIVNLRNDMITLQDEDLSLLFSLDSKIFCKLRKLHLDFQ